MKKEKNQSDEVLSEVLDSKLDYGEKRTLNILSKESFFKSFYR